MLDPSRPFAWLARRFDELIRHQPRAAWSVFAVLTALPVLLALYLSQREIPCLDCPSDTHRPAHVLLIGIDGLSRRALGQGHTPTLDTLAETGTRAANALASMPTMSAPNWGAILLGAPPGVNGVRGNAWRPWKWRDQAFCGRPTGAGWPGLFDLMAEQRSKARTAAIHHWVGIGRLIRPGVADRRVWTIWEGRTVRLAARLLRRGPPVLTFVHFDHVDGAGHGFGWDSAEYMEAVARADAHVARLLRALETAGARERTLVIVVSDHGGRGRFHGGKSPEELEIPWIANGPGAEAGAIILGEVGQPDTTTTVAAALGLSPPDCWTGRNLLPGLAGQPD